MLPWSQCYLLLQAERRYNSKLYDMRDRLDQANSTTRSMQNYVSFLKSSYSNVFDELESPRWRQQHSWEMFTAWERFLFMTKTYLTFCTLLYTWTNKHVFKLSLKFVYVLNHFHLCSTYNARVLPAITYIIHHTFLSEFHFFHILDHFYSVLQFYIFIVTKY